VIGVYHSSSLGELNTLSNTINPGNLPDVAVRPLNTQKLSLGWYKIGSSSLSDADRMEGFKSTIANTGNIITNYHRYGSADKVSAIRSFQIVYGDNLDLPFEDECADAVISIAVIHHFSTKERRIKALSEIFRIFIL